MIFIVLTIENLNNSELGFQFFFINNYIFNLLGFKDISMLLAILNRRAQIILLGGRVGG